VSDEQARVRNAFKAQVAQSKDAANLLLLAQMEMALGLRREACETLQEALALFPDNAEIKNAMAQIGCK
jgi:cytochrome c-type biogenesis protein CcmH/NrfG